MMPVFIGGEFSVPAERLVAIVDFAYFAKGENKAYLDSLAKGGRLVDITENSKPRAVVITDNEAYLSNIQPLTLKRRTDRLRQGICEFNCVEEI